MNIFIFLEDIRGVCVEGVEVSFRLVLLIWCFLVLLIMILKIWEFILVLVFIGYSIDIGKG